MADALQLEIVTPSGVALRAKVAELTAPSVAGEFGVLPGHVPVLAALRAGTVTYREGSEDHKVAVGPGFVEVLGDTAIILTEKFSKKDQIDVIQTRIRLKEVDDELVAWAGEISDPRRADLIEEEQWLGALLELYGDPPPPTLREDTRFVQRTDEVVVDSGDGAAEDTTTTHGNV
jgi:F-type H+-transporting ATPase subunit epsilon